MVKVADWKLEAFNWLPIERWTPDHLLSDYQVSGLRYCKVCDAWVSLEDEKKHCAAHRKQRRDQIKRARLEALKKAREERARRKREREL